MMKNKRSSVTNPKGEKTKGINLLNKYVLINQAITNLNQIEIRIQNID